MLHEAEEHRIRAIDRLDDGMVIHCACGWRSRPLDAQDVAYVWTQHEGART